MLFIALSLQCCKEKAIKEGTVNLNKVDSIPIWINQAKGSNLDYNSKQNLLLKAYRLSLKRKNDSVKVNMLRTLTNEFYKLNDTTIFLEANDKTYNLSVQLKDTFTTADVFWNKGNYFSDKEILDSSYYYFYKAQKLFSTIGQNYYSAKMLYNMSVIQKDLKDYTGSEITTFKAIEIFKENNNYLNLYRCYNNLGVVFSNLEEYDKSIEYHTLALDFLDKVEDKKTFPITNLNNIGLAYQSKRDYDNAIKYFNRGLEYPDLDQVNPNLYSKLLDNLTYSRFLKGDNNNIEKDFKRALEIRDSINFTSGSIISKLHLSEFYANQRDTLKALDFAKQALSLSQEVNNNRDQLEALLLLSKLDKSESSNFLNSYIKLNDSLQSYERAIRDKFTRIRFETDEYIERTEKLSFQKTIIIFSGIGAILILSLLYFIKIQRSKNKQLSLERDQQQANEEIYKLMLAQQSKLEEGRLEERNRISEELHDGVLGKMYGTRMSLGLLDLEDVDQAKKQQKLYLQDLQKIEKEIRTISHELKNEILLSKTDYFQLIETLLEKQSGNFKYKIEEDKNVDWSNVNDSVKMNLYRIIQEVVQNINKHAQATRVDFHFSLKENRLNLAIQDNGVGFEVKKSYKGIGIKNIESRIRRLHGEFSIASVKGSGTQFNIIIPINSNENN